eukprot:scaffold78782_cov57-Phaeocystis_antarctica.AAC.3
MARLVLLRGVGGRPLGAVVRVAGLRIVTARVRLHPVRGRRPAARVVAGSSRASAGLLAVGRRRRSLAVRACRAVAGAVAAAAVGGGCGVGGGGGGGLGQHKGGWPRVARPPGARRRPRGRACRCGVVGGASSVGSGRGKAHRRLVLRMRRL